MNRSWSVTLLVVAVVLTGVTVAGVAAPVVGADDRHAFATEAPTHTARQAIAVVGAGTAVAASSSPVPRFTADRFDRTEFVIRVDRSGTARWTVRYKQTLANASETEDFRAFADGFESEETAIYTDFRSTARRLVAEGSEEVGREMAARDFSRSASIDENLGQQDTGVVEMSFVWVGFANATDDEVVVGDVFEGGLYIGANQELVVRPGQDLRFESVDPPGTYSGATLPASDSVTWQGELSFSDNRPRVVLVPRTGDKGTTTTTVTSVTASATPTPTTMVGGNGGNGDDGTDARVDASGGGDDSMLLLAAGVFVLLGSLAAAVALRRRQPDGGDTAAGETTSDGPDDPGGAVAADTTSETEPQTETMGGDAGSVPAEPPSDEERVLALLSDNGGQMKQSAIVEESGWSKSKVSMVLSEMADDGDISKIQVGRENLISLQGHEPAAARSPFDEAEE